MYSSVTNNTRRDCILLLTRLFCFFHDTYSVFSEISFALRISAKGKLAYLQKFVRLLLVIQKKKWVWDRALLILT